jgi:hypothetical protein
MSANVGGLGWQIGGPKSHPDARGSQAKGHGEGFAQKRPGCLVLIGSVPDRWLPVRFPKLGVSQGVGKRTSPSTCAPGSWGEMVRFRSLFSGPTEANGVAMRPLSWPGSCPKAAFLCKAQGEWSSGRNHDRMS